MRPQAPPRGFKGQLPEEAGSSCTAPSRVACQRMYKECPAAAGSGVHSTYRCGNMLICEVTASSLSDLQGCSPFSGTLLSSSPGLPVLSIRSTLGSVKTTPSPLWPHPWPTENNALCPPKCPALSSPSHPTEPRLCPGAPSHLRPPPCPLLCILQSL